MISNSTNNVLEDCKIKNKMNNNWNHFILYISQSWSLKYLVSKCFALTNYFALQFLTKIKILRKMKKISHDKNNIFLSNDTIQPKSSCKFWVIHRSLYEFNTNFSCYDLDFSEKFISYHMNSMNRWNFCI